MANYVLGFDDVRRLLPQSYPFILVDVVEEVEPGKRIICRKNVTGNEWMFPGHFPQQAIFPGVLLIEGMAQASILLWRIGRSCLDSSPGRGSPTPLQAAENATYMLASAKTRFLKPVVPGDQLRYVCEAIRLARMGGVIEAMAFVDGEVVAKADLTFAVRDSEE